MNNTITKATVCCLAAGWPLAASLLFGAEPVARSDEPAKGATKQVDLGGDGILELVYIPPGEFTMGSSAEERAWATGIEGGATPGTTREKPEGDPRLKIGRASCRERV